jgi:hypothetical protein
VKADLSRLHVADIKSASSRGRLGHSRQITEASSAPTSVCCCSGRFSSPQYSAFFCVFICPDLPNILVFSTDLSSRHRSWATFELVTLYDTSRQHRTFPNSAASSHAAPCFMWPSGKRYPSLGFFICCQCTPLRPEDLVTLRVASLVRATLHRIWSNSVGIIGRLIAQERSLCGMLPFSFPFGKSSDRDKR